MVRFLYCKLTGNPYWCGIGSGMLDGGIDGMVFAAILAIAIFFFVEALWLDF